MMKNIFCLYCLMLCVWPVLAGAAEIDDLLNRLDVVIKDRPHCIVEKKKRLQELKLRLYPGLPDEERFRQLGELLEEYRSFNADSSLAFTQERLHLARRMGGREPTRCRATCVPTISTTCAPCTVGWRITWWCPKKRHATGR